MSEISAIHVALLIISTAIGAVVGWVVRGNRSQQEKAVVNAGWQEQLEAQRKDYDRLLDRNKGLMEQASQFQASNNDARNRAKELSQAVQEAFARRDELQREIKDIRSNLEVAVTERDQLQSNAAAHSEDRNLLRQKDERIEELTRELQKWQDRLPPLVERFRQRNEEADRLEKELVIARDRIRALEREGEGASQTRIEPAKGADKSEITSGQQAEDTDDTESGAESLPQQEHEPEPESDADSELQENSEEHTSRDDLKLIKGVGPAIEKTLNEIGIFRFEQIADMSEYDIDRVARRLRGFHSRIYREDWIGQARDLLDQAESA